jgi:anti-sigma regulatory factor (Ser/Thr protein kinase)
LRKQIRVRSERDLTRAIVETSQVARSSGFDAAKVSKLATATSELARNILKYAGSGEIRIQAVDDGPSHGIEIVARDRGPGITDVEAALQDHYSSSGTLGLGLPGVRRMMDEFAIETEVGRGTTITILAWQAKPRTLLSQALQEGATRRELERSLSVRDQSEARQVNVGPEFDLAYVIRPYQGELVSGDEVYVERRSDRLLVALIDALGHGTSANRAARHAKAVMRENCTASVVALMRTLHDALSSTVGAAISICEINVLTYTGQYCSVGNTVGRILGPRDVRLHSVAGIVGSNLRTPVQDRFSLNTKDVLVLYSDGISDRFGKDDYPQLGYQHSKAIVGNVLQRFGKQHDDASCVALRRLA